ncbi:MAG: hypothetical protein E7037_02965 [Verrucomicrobia bacterium]|nr:hypothetical protein [Verrucomicrobiota bacterium]
MKQKTFLKRLVLVACLFSVLVIPSALAAKKGVPFEGVYGRIRFVDSFADYDVKIVEHHEDLRVQLVERFPDSCGKWQIVDRFPDYKIRIVDAHPDFTIRYVNSFPGVN